MRSMSRILYTKVVISVEECWLPIVKKSDYVWKRTANTFTTIVGPWLYQCRTTTYFSLIFLQTSQVPSLLPSITAAAMIIYMNIFMELPVYQCCILINWFNTCIIMWVRCHHAYLRRLQLRHEMIEPWSARWWYSWY